MSWQAIRFASFPVSSVAPTGFYHPPSLPGFVSLTAYPHPRRHLSKRAVFGSSFDAVHAIIAPPHRTPGRNDLRRLIMAIIQRPAHSTSTTRRRTGRGDDVRFFDRCLDRCASFARRGHRRPIAYRPHGFPSKRDGNSQGIHTFRAVFLSSSHPTRLIASSVPSWQASRQGKTAGGHRRPSAPSSHLRPGPSSPRLAPRVGSVARPWDRRLIDGKGKQNAPLPLSRNGAKSIQTLYRTREL